MSPTPRLEVPKPRLGVPKYRLGVPKPRFRIPKLRLGVPRPRLGSGCPVDSPNRAARLNAPREGPVEGPRLATGC